MYYAGIKGYIGYEEFFVMVTGTAIIIGDNSNYNSISLATRSAPWPLTAAKAATGFRRMHQESWH